MQPEDQAWFFELDNFANDFRLRVLVKGWVHITTNILYPGIVSIFLLYVILEK
jgi:hypothetical protein